MALLEIRNVSIHFGGVQALQNVSFDVRQGEVAALIGPNGAGKTTMFNCISCFNTANEGTITYNGKQIQNLKPHQLAEIGIARTFQNIRLISDRTVLENIRLGHHIHLKQNIWDTLIFSSRYKSEEQKSELDAKEIIDFVGMSAQMNELAGSLPYGSRRRMEIARAIATGAKLLMLDEPCAGMNTAEKDDLSMLIQKINTNLHRTVLVIEHDMRFVMGISHNITVLSQGKLIAHGTPKEIQNDPVVIEAYLGTKRRQLSNVGN